MGIGFACATEKNTEKISRPHGALSGPIDDVLWETTPLFNKTVFQVSHFVNPTLSALADVLLQQTPNLVI